MRYETSYAKGLWIAVCLAFVCYLSAGVVEAQDDDAANAASAAAEMARKLQDPLANIKALMTDNGVQFNTGRGGTRRATASSSSRYTRCRSRIGGSISSIAPSSLFSAWPP